MNVFKCMLPLGLLVLLGLAMADAMAADKNYECVVKDSVGRRLIHTASGPFLALTSDTYTVAGSDAAAAEPAAIAAANSEHNNKAVSACCVERPPMDLPMSQSSPQEVTPVARNPSGREPTHILLQVGCGFPLGLLLSSGVSAAQAQAASRNYECVVKDSAGKRLLHTESGVFNPTTETYSATATDAVAAEPVALAQANKEHSNKAVSACCIERTTTTQKKF